MALGKKAVHQFLGGRLAVYLYGHKDDTDKSAPLRPIAGVVSFWYDIITIIIIRLGVDSSWKIALLQLTQSCILPL